MGVDALLLTVPAYNKPPQEGLYQHFKAIAGAVELPCVVYNVTSRTSLNMTDETTIRLSEIDNIVGVKEAGSDMDQITRIIDGAKPGFLLWSGNDNETFPIMATGGYGVVSVLSHIIGTQINLYIEPGLTNLGSLKQCLWPVTKILPFPATQRKGLIELRAVFFMNNFCDG